MNRRPFNWYICLVVLSLLVVLSINFSQPVRAEISGDYEYYLINNGTEVEIWHYLGPGGHVEIPDKIEGKPVTSIFENAFSGCASLTSVIIPDEVQTISRYTFYECTSLVSVNISIGVTSIEDEAFYGCVALNELNVDPNNPYFSSQDGVLYDRNMSTLFIYPEAKVGAFTIPTSVTMIEPSAFARCKSLTSIDLPKNVTSIGNWAFTGCSALTSMIIPTGVAFIGEYAFWGCTNIDEYVVASDNSYYASVDGVLYDHSIGKIIQYCCGRVGAFDIPVTVTSIGAGAFSFCHLTNVTIPDSVDYIGSDAFAFSLSLSNITIPDSVTSIGDGAFWSCNSLASIEIAEGVKTMGNYTFFNCTSLRSATIRGNLNMVGFGAFIYCGNLTSVEIDYGLTSIGMYMFNGCTSLNSINIPESVTKIENSAFAFCTSITSLSIPKSVTLIGEDAFLFCRSLVTFNVDASNSNYSSVDGVLYSKNATTLVAFPCGRAGEFIIPSGVTAIGNGAFYGCPELTVVTIPAGMKWIGNYAFGYSNLTQLYFQGNAPERFGMPWIYPNNPNLTIYFFNGSNGFITPKMWGIPTTCLSVPSSPLNVQATSGNGYIKISWSKPTYNSDTISHYTIYRGNGSSFARYMEVDATHLLFQDKNVTNGQTYQYWVSAENENGEGTHSELTFASEGNNKEAIGSIVLYLAIGSILVLLAISVLLVRSKNKQ
jgi:hypothetical protein